MDKRTGINRWVIFFALGYPFLLLAMAVKCPRELAVEGKWKTHLALVACWIMLWMPFIVLLRLALDQS